MSLKISVKPDTKDLERTLGRLVEEEIPFATAHALTLTAKAAAQAEKEFLPKVFIIRRARVAKGIQSRSATKRNLTAEVGSLDPFMVLQEDGGEKDAHGPAMGVPVMDKRYTPIRGADKRKAITPSLWPANQKNSFVMKTSKGPVLAQRYGKELKKRIKGERRVRLLFKFKRKVSIKARWGFFLRVERMAGPAFKAYFIETYQAAIARASR